MAKRKSNFSLNNLFGKVSFEDKTFFARQLSIMLDAGVSLSDAVRSVASQTSNNLAKKTFEMVLDDLENGMRFAEALRKHPKVFNNVFVSVVAAGEASGKLDTALNSLSDELERDNSFRSKAYGALYYPAFIVVALFVVAIIMATRVIPALESVFTEANMDLPLATKIVISVTNSFIGFWYVYILVFAGIIYGLIKFGQTEDGRELFNNIILATPGIGKMLMNLEMARFTRILGLMMESGVPIIQAINSSAEVMDISRYRNALKIVAQNVERGAPISQTLERFDEFPTNIREMIAVGERSGRLEAVLKKLADFYTAQTEQAIKNVSSLIEPIVFVVVGLAVAFLIFSVVVPIYSLSGAIN